MGSSMKHTPGPWRVDRSALCDVQAGDLEIATTHPNVLDGGEAPGLDVAVANAALIAAAPDLLAALRALSYFCWDGYDGDADEKRLLDAATDAIARAEGGAR